MLLPAQLAAPLLRFAYRRLSGPACRRVLLAGLALGVAASSAQATPITAFDVIAPATVNIVYNPDFCSLPNCQINAAFPGALTAATTEPVDVSRVRLRAALNTPVSGISFRPIRTGGGTLLPSEVTFPLGGGGAFTAELLPGESFTGGGPYAIDAFLTFPDSFVGDVLLNARVKLTDEDAVARFPILLHFTQTSEHIPGSPSRSTVTSTQRLSPTAIPEPLTFSLLLTAAAGLVVRSSRRGRTKRDRSSLAG